MNLRSLMLHIDILNGVTIPNVEINGVHFHSKKVNTGGLFIAIDGQEADGHEFIQDAIQHGASVVIGEKRIRDLEVPYIQVEKSRNALALVAQRFYQSLLQDRIIIGITGTNGKTTTTHMLQHILAQNGINCSRIGSVTHLINNEEIPSTNTTPDPIELHQLLAKSKDDAVIVEVSSHGLAQGRVDGITFDFALFTNLSHDHLDYHHTLEQYFETKCKLFTLLKPSGEAIINTSSSWGQTAARSLKEQKRNVFQVGENRLDDLQLLHANTEFATFFETKEALTHQCFLQVPGTHNHRNASMSFVAARRMGLGANDIKKALATFPGVPGRFETYVMPSTKATCVVDYAHTPDAIMHSLATIRSAGAKRIFHLFGFRGNGDPSKRELMLKISSANSDAYVLTFDDLYGIHPEDMRHTLYELQSQVGNDKGTIIEDRTLAIQHVLLKAEAGDWILISGKGPETYKEAFMYPTTTDAATIKYVMDHLYSI